MVTRDQLILKWLRAVHRAADPLQSPEIMAACITAAGAEWAALRAAQWKATQNGSVLTTPEMED